MNKMLIAAALLGLSFNATVTAEPMSDVENCALLARRAEIIMELRQEGISMRSMIDRLNAWREQWKPENGGSQTLQYGAGILHDIRVDYAKAAYKHPKYSAESKREEAVNEFGSEIVLNCLSE